jgi:hypothetical protein
MLRTSSAGTYRASIRCIASLTAVRTVSEKGEEIEWHVKTIHVQKEEAVRLREDVEDESRLLSLPPELRHQIFELVLPQDKRLSYTCWRANNWTRTDVAVTQVCHTMRTETIPMFYGCNTFVIDVSTTGLLRREKEWIDSLDILAINSLQALEISTDSCKFAKMLQARYLTEADLQKLISG